MTRHKVFEKGKTPYWIEVEEDTGRIDIIKGPNRTDTRKELKPDSKEMQYMPEIWRMYCEIFWDKFSNLKESEI
jgi:hypothetical protein